MRRGFTLVEMMVVIAVLSILMTITMNFGSSRINELKYQNIKEQFVANYEKLYSQNMTSNYNNGNRYENLQININQNKFYALWDSGNMTDYSKDELMMTGLQLDGNTGSNLMFGLKPYSLGCQISEGKNTGSKASLNIIIDNTKNYCFEIKSDTCKLIEKICPSILEKKQIINE